MTDSGNGQAARVLELYYKVEEVAFLLRFSNKWVRERMNAGEFGAGVVDVRGDVRIPASGVNRFLAQHQRVYDIEVRRTNAGRLRRQLARKALNGEVQTSGRT